MAHRSTGLTSVLSALAVVGGLTVAAPQFAVADTIPGATTGLSTATQQSPFAPDCDKRLAGTVTWGYKASTLKYVGGDGLIETLPGSTYSLADRTFTFGIDNKKSVRSSDGTVMLHLTGGTHLRKYCENGSCLMDQKLENLVVKINADGGTGSLFADVKAQDTGKDLYNPKPVDKKAADIAKLAFGAPSMYTKEGDTSEAAVATSTPEITTLIWVTYNKAGTKLAPITVKRECGAGPAADEQTRNPNRKNILFPPADNDSDADNDSTGNGNETNGKRSDGSSKPGSSSANKNTKTVAPEGADSTNGNSSSRQRSGNDKAEGSSRKFRDGFGNIYDSVLTGALSLGTLAVVIGVLSIIVQHAVALARR